ncbi:MAG: HlyD family secretion protein [candidate division NC10 bacterium]|nr:HlyD family secretion protein [candidate division NC10 bacterium]
MRQDLERLLSQRKILILVGGAFLLVFAVGGGLLWRYYATHVSTDDAFVEGRVSPVSAKVKGIIIRVLVDDNEEVKEGQVLVELDPKDYQVKLEQAKAAVAIAESQLKAAAEQVPFSRETTLGQIAQAEAALQAASAAVQTSRLVVEQAKAIVASREAAVAVAEAELRAAQAFREKARLDYDRMERLVDERAIAQQEYDLAKASDDAASAQVAAAEKKVSQASKELDAAMADLKAKESGYAYSPVHLGVESAKAKAEEVKAQLAEARAKQRGVKIREAERELAAARLKETLADLELAKLQLDYTVIRAPMAGRVTKKTVEVGQVIQPGQPLMAIVSLRDVWIVANFKETQLTHVRTGQKVKITVDTYPGKVFTGTVESIQAGTGARFSLLPPENATGNFVKVVQRIPVKIVLDKHPNPHILRPGMSVVPTIELR